MKKSIMAALAVWGLSASAATWYVSPDGSDENDGMSEQTAFKTPGYAATKATTAEDTILLAKGMYSLEAVVSINNASLIGATGNPDDVILDGQRKTNCVILNKGRIANVTVCNGYRHEIPLYACGAGIAGMNGVVISNCVVRGCVLACEFYAAHRGGAGIFLESVAENLIASCRVYDNVLTNCAGAGINAYGPSVITNCMVYNNSGWQDTTLPNGGLTGGGGIKINTGVIVDCQVYSNTLSAAEGGGISCNGGNVQILRTRVFGNTMSASGVGGAGIAFRNNVWVKDSQIVSNSVAGSGGGISFCGLTNVLSNCLIEGNTATVRGGGLHCYTVANPHMSYVMDGCVVRGNKSDRLTGGFDVNPHGQMDVDGEIVIRNSLIVENSGKEWASALNLCSTNVTISSCTIARNYSSASAPGILCETAVVMTNCILSANVLNNNQTNNVHAWSVPGYLDKVAYSLEDTGKLQGGAGIANLNADPLLDAAYTPLAKSPCRDVGYVEPWMMVVGARDVYGNKRICGSGVDLGAVERFFPIGTMMIVR